jgi:hypothetical protein
MSIEKARDRADRFVARMVAAAGDTLEVRRYADRAWDRYYGEKAFAHQRPEDLADTDMSYWEDGA